jgi:YVTN family beta-propeller protein
MVTRRTFVAGGLGASLAGGLTSLASCGGHDRATGFAGYAFVANQEGGAIAVVDLGVFAVARHIRVDGAPTAVLANPRGSRVYALTPENGSVHEIRAGNLTFSRKLKVAAAALEMRLAPAGDALYILCRKPKQLVRLALTTLRVDWTLPLADDPADFDISPDGSTIAISSGSGCSVTFVDLPNRRSFPPLRTSGEIGVVRFQPWHGPERAQSDSRQLIAANVSQRMLSIFDVPSRRLMVHLPLAVRPDHLCFNADGGQVFVTGEGLDAVVVVYPYYTPQIGQTVLAGHSPGAMAASASGYLFVANPTSAGVSILDIETSKVLAVTPVGTEPSCIAITPDDQYALVLNQASGDMAVIRIKNVARAAHWRKGPLFMLIPVGSKPVSAAIVRV